MQRISLIGDCVSTHMKLHSNIIRPRWGKCNAEVTNVSAVSIANMLAVVSFTQAVAKFFFFISVLNFCTFADG